MNRFGTFLAATLMSAAMLLASPAQAMEIRQFDKMADQDQSEYIGNLIVGAENALIDEGKPNLAAQIKTLFTTKNPGDADVIGMVEFEMNLAQARVVDAQKAEQDPKARRLEVEDAMLVVLQKNGVPMSRTFVKAFRAINNNSQPKFGPAAASTPPPKPALSDGASVNSAGKPMVVHNADGTFTVQKEPANRDAQDAEGKKGLVIPAQVVTPTILTGEKAQ